MQGVRQGNAIFGYMFYKELSKDLVEKKFIQRQAW